ncbi:uncharacterized protein LOC107460986 [Arachis duranensis]|uniref:Uncharacterized protein LOC107460986 n=1 Tax=Arachis duranensis TaxID=130453 RepID=A0A9C6WBP9_ARADU|nr:uncharacterized protein LOC107460986 [Arachis duranensis]
MTENSSIEVAGMSASTQPSSLPSGVRKNRSAGWDYFDVENAIKKKVKCKYYGSLIQYGNGTSSMGGHLRRCKQNPNNDSNKRRKITTTPTIDEHGVLNSLSASKFDQEEARRALVEMFIGEELPFRFVEIPKFRRFMHILQARFKVPSRITLAHDNGALYAEEKMKLQNFLSANYGRKHRKEFELLALKDNTYIGEMSGGKGRGVPSDSDWEYAESIVPFLRVFSDAIEVFTIGRFIRHSCDSVDFSTMSMAERMRVKYEKYWGNPDSVNKLLLIAIQYQSSEEASEADTQDIQVDNINTDVHGMGLRREVAIMLETVPQIGIYFHRFHNLDLFKQGWYRIKITMRWDDDNENQSFGIPSRVVQYEAPDEMDPSYIKGIWRIEEKDNSFSTQPFRIRYAKQDIYLCIMILFNLFHTEFEGFISTAVILKFELMYVPKYYDNGGELEASLDSSPTIHEFRIPPKALLGLHSYCPVYFDSLHAVLIDVTVHTCILKSSSKFPRNSGTSEVNVGQSYNTVKNNQGFGAIAYLDVKKKMFIKALLTARDILLEELQRLSKAIDQAIDISEFLENKIQILKYLRETWCKDRKVEWSIWMVYSKVEMPHHYINNGINLSSNRGKHKRALTLWKLNDEPIQTAVTRAEMHRRSIAQMRINNRSIQDMHIFGDPLRTPIVIVEHVITNEQRRTISQDSYLIHTKLFTASHSFQRLPNITHQSEHHFHVLNIVVFVHGFQGHHLDLRLVRNQWVLIDPEVEFLMSEANEDRTTSDDFRIMGQRLAKEVISFVKRKMDKASNSGILGDIQLSFVGHSMGNLIIRSALADSLMEPYLRYLYTYMSISGPHLGYLYSSNSLFNSGLWLFKKLKGTQCIHQLTFTDDPHFQNTFLYKLSKQKTLEYFRNIILISSPQDGYIPYHSARIESCPAASHDKSKKGRMFIEMLNDILDQVRVNHDEHRRVLMRCDVNFDVTSYGKNLNSFVGRAAHIEFLESDIYAKFIMWSFPELFK